MLKKQLLTLFSIILCSHVIIAQDCLQTGLSDNFNFRIITIKGLNEDSLVHTIKLELLIIDKIKNVEVQKIEFNAEETFDADFDDCSNIRSYVTGLNETDEAPDNDYGDFIVADFNFDDKEDFAIKKYWAGGSSGPVYNYYIQDRAGKFVKDSYLSEEVEFFPSKFDKKRTSLQVIVPVGACSIAKHVYSFNTRINKWKEKSHRLKSYCKK
ncbi:XAC2610-related protein [Adhaeribacter pallidiroseus]|uniref:Uncharacterized protein n=1 Tax=Adhaeribacter pallidiroseus TaxID=2072847 RepID=A0A369QLY6_9BACT|nr:hypothetical protein [Adhaeribacter pallidiroseus]RDC64236.1 hypothetical protein AHMF7616_02848 [Adhaeribacter pallidiroseus]